MQCRERDASSGSGYAVSDARRIVIMDTPHSYNLGHTLIQDGSKRPGRGAFQARTLLLNDIVAYSARLSAILSDRRS